MVSNISEEYASLLSLFQRGRQHAIPESWCVPTGMHGARYHNLDDYNMTVHFGFSHCRDDINSFMYMIYQKICIPNLTIGNRNQNQTIPCTCGGVNDRQWTMDNLTACNRQQFSMKLIRTRDSWIVHVTKKLPWVFSHTNIGRGRGLWVKIFNCNITGRK
jgi:hypothetical protein